MTLLEPQSDADLAAVLRQAYQENCAVIPRGAGTKSEWGNPPARADVTISLQKLNRLTEHAWADLTVTAEAGCTIAEVQRVVAKHGQRLAVDPLWPERATVGGVLSANDTGVLRYRYGGLRDLIIGVTVALADGTLAKSGGKVVKNVAGYDLSKLVTGAMGTLGVITSATFRLHPLPKQSRTVTITSSNLAEMQSTLMKIRDSQFVPTALQTRVGRGAPQIDLLFEGIDAGIDAQVTALSRIASVSDGVPEVWQRLDADAKISILPSQTAELLDGLEGYAVMQGTGIGWVQTSQLVSFREKIEKLGGSLVLMRRHQGRDGRNIDAWGAPTDTLPLIRAVKKQFDPRNVMNPGCFVGGI